MNRPIVRAPRRRCAAPSSSASTSSTRPTRTAPRSARRSSPRRCTPTRTTSSSRRRAASNAPDPDAGPPTGSPSTCERRAREASSGCASTRSRSTSSTGPTPTCRSRSRSVRSSSSRTRARSSTSGCATSPRTQLRRAQQQTPIVSVQNRYNVTDRTSETMVDLCEQEGLTFLPWAPVLDLDRTPVVQEIADGQGATARQVALAWLLARSPAILPIPGTGSVDPPGVQRGGHEPGARSRRGRRDHRSASRRHLARQRPDAVDIVVTGGPSPRRRGASSAAARSAC